MRLRYYKPNIYKKIKEMYFKNFQYLNIDDIILDGTFEKNIKYMIKDLDANYFEFEKLINDYIDCGKETHIAQSNMLQEYISHLYVSDDIIFNTLQNISNPTRKVIDILNNLSTQSCIVGGAIRDILMGNIPKDYDFVTDASYDQMILTFKENGFTVIETGKQFLVLNVKYGDEKFEIVNFRKDGTYIDGRRPDSVSIGTIEDDSNRRDFTINSLYYNLFTRELIDPTGLGIEHITTKTLCFVGDAQKRLEEDYLRGWRFFRFLNKGYLPEHKSFTAIKRNWNDIYTKSNSERVLREQIKNIEL